MAITYNGSGVGGAIQSGVDQWTTAQANLVRDDLLNHDSRATDLETLTTDHEARLDAVEAGTADFDGIERVATGVISSSELLALRATPKTLVAAPGAGKLIEFVSIDLLLDATATAYVESTANLGVRYENGSGTQVSETIEATGFINQTVDTWIKGQPAAQVAMTKTASENKALVLHNLGAGEYTTGTGVVRFKCIYRVWTTGW